LSSTARPQTSAQSSAPLDLTGRITYFGLQGIGSLAASFYFNYFFFYVHDHYGFGNRENLLITTFYGLLYTVAAWYAGRFITRFGPSIALKTGFTGMGLAMVLGGLAPMIFGYSQTTLIIQLALIFLWTVTMCQTWPTLQGLLSRNQSPRQLSRTAGLYNIMWSGTSALAYPLSGLLLDHFHGEILFWVAAVLHLAQLIWLWCEERRARSNPVADVSELDVGKNGNGSSTEHHPATPGKSMVFLHLAWVANPFAYVAIYGLIPVIPVVANGFHLTATEAGYVCSVWQWVRLGSFALFWLWTGWHYRFRYLLSAYLGMAMSFLGILLCQSLALLIAAQIVFGISIGLIYYSSLFYSMDLGASKGKGGGIHEAAIGMGVCCGPAIGVVSLMLFPTHPSASTYGMSGLIVAGLALVLWVKLRKKQA
jgi:predicted MFS family arabinose efflux permease